jgi:hypothetical protein
MIDYNTDVGNVNGVLGNYTAKNASGATAVDGTPYVASFIDDIWGPKQALMDLAGLTPNGVTESVSASQILDAMKKGFNLGAGYIIQYDKVNTPAVNGDRVLLLTGQGVLISNYGDLTTAMYVGDGNNATASAYYKADDAAGTIRNIAGTYLILPDYRGVVPRGLDAAASIDPDGASRSLGGLQGDTFQQFQAGANADNTGAREYWLTAEDRDETNQFASGTNASPIISRTSAAGQGSVRAVIPKNDGTNGDPRMSTETRMYNVATTFGITY